MALKRTNLYIAAALAALAAVALLGASRMSAQPPPGAVQITPVASPVPAAPTANMADPDAKVPFSMAPHGPVKRINKRTASGGSIPYYTFISKGKRTYSVEIPVSMVKDARSKDEWVTLFACYGSDAQGQADVRATGNAGFDPYFTWAAQRAATQAQAVSLTHQRLNKVVAMANQWAVIHRQAKTNNDKLEAQAAWARIAVAKSDMSKLLKQLASEKLKLANIYKDNGSYEQARQQYLQIASLDVPPYSREAIAKLRVIEGAQPTPGQFTSASAVGAEWIQQSQLFQAAQKATTTSP